jgi:hypothetical protein
MEVMTRAEEILRRFEREVLDPHHQTLALWSRPRGDAVLAVLEAYDSLNFLMATLPAPPTSPADVQKMKSLDEGFTQAMRWLFQPDVVLPDEVTTDVVEEAGQFLLHASAYVDIADMHMAFGRGLVALNADEATRRVEFGSQSLDSFAFIETVSTQASRDIPRVANMADGMFMQLKAAVARVPFSIHGRRVSVDDPTLLSDATFDVISEMLIPKAGFFLPEGVDLGGFTVHEFNEVWKALVRWSFVCEGIAMNEVMRRRNSLAAVATQVVDVGAFVRVLTDMTGMPAPTIEAVVDRLTLDTRTVRSDVFQQPLIASEGRCCWSPRLVTQSRHQRNMLKLMARTPALSDLAATIIGNGERPLLRDLGDVLAKRGGYQYKLCVPLRVGDDESDADLLAYTRKAPTEVLLVEAKAVLPPDEVNEVARVTNDLIGAQDQALAAIRLLRDMPDPQRQKLFPFVDWGRVRQFCPLVLTPETAPVPPYDHTRVPGIGLQTLRTRLRSRDFRTPRRLCSACQEREWMRPYMTAETTTREFEVGDVTYVLPARFNPDA